jgi:hypothetical protein
MHSALPSPIMKGWIFYPSVSVRSQQDNAGNLPELVDQPHPMKQGQFLKRCVRHRWAEMGVD